MARWLGDALSVQARTEVYETTERQAATTAHLDVPDYVAIQAEFPARVHTTIEISAHATNGGANSALLFGTKATLRADFDAKTLAVAKRGSTDFAPVEIRGDEAQEWRVEAEFIGAIRGQEEVHMTDFATGVRYMRFTDAVNESAASGQRIPL